MLKTIQTTKVFKDLNEAYKTGKYNIIKLEGGSRSSKTWSIFQFLYALALNGESYDVTIARQYLQLIKDTLLRDFIETTEKYGIPVSPEINENRSTQRYQILDGNTEFLFWGLDKPKKAHGKKQKITWINEAMEITNKQVFDQLEMRTEKLMIIDYNPSDDGHWVFDLDKRPDVVTLKSTQLDNPFLPIKIRRKILSYEPTPENIENGTADLYMWQVYGLGERAKLEGLVFERWYEVDAIPDGARRLGYGLDYGYSIDPTTFIGVYMYENELYLDEMLWRTGMTNQDIGVELRLLNIEPTDEIYPDEAEPKSNEELRRMGFRIRPAPKGPDSINFGIDILKQYKINITKRSLNLKKEFNRYKWATDANGDIVRGANGKPKPIDEFNHGVDPTRYVASTVLKRVQEVKVLSRSSFG